MAAKFNFGKRLRVIGHEYRKTEYGTALRWGCSCKNRFVSKRWHPSFKGNNPPSSFFSKTLLIIFTIQFFILFSETLIISQTKSWVSQNNIKYKSKFEVNRTQRYGASQSHSSCCELIGHRRATDEVVPAAGLRIV